MIRIIDHKGMGKSDRGWLRSIFHFSFAEYHNPENVQFGTLRVINDDQVEPGRGFGTHPHRDMEIVSYVVDGALTHEDSMGNSHTLTRGQVQYMSAGTGITHSEFNRTKDPLRFLQIWILPDKENHTPNYGDHRFVWEDRVNRWLQIASGDQEHAPIKIHQDMDIFVLSLDAGEQLSRPIAQGRQVYLVQIEGNGRVNGRAISQRDAAELVGETEVSLHAQEQSHYILFDMPAA